MRVLKDEYNVEWEEKRRVEMHELQNKGVIPVLSEDVLEKQAKFRPLLLGQAIGGVKDQLPAAVILNNMVQQAAEILTKNNGLVVKSAKL